MLPLEGVAEWFRLPVAEIRALCREAGVGHSRAHGIADRDLDVLADALQGVSRADLRIVVEERPVDMARYSTDGPFTRDEAPRLRATRHRYGLSQTGAASLLGCSDAAFGAWERGDRPCAVGTADALDAACRDLPEAEPPASARNLSPDQAAFRATRLRLGLSYNAAAQLLRCGETTLARWETVTRVPPGLGADLEAAYYAQEARR